MLKVLQNEGQYNYRNIDSYIKHLDKIIYRYRYLYVKLKARIGAGVFFYYIHYFSCGCYYITYYPFFNSVKIILISNKNTVKAQSIKFHRKCNLIII